MKIETVNKSISKLLHTNSFKILHSINMETVNKLISKYTPRMENIGALTK